MVEAVNEKEEQGRLTKVAQREFTVHGYVGKRWIRSKFFGSFCSLCQRERFVS